MIDARVLLIEKVWKHPDARELMLRAIVLATGRAAMEVAAPDAPDEVAAQIRILFATPLV